MNIQNNGIITIATGHSRKSITWKNTELHWSALLEQISEPVITKESYDAFMRMPKDQQVAIKDVGGFVGGALRGGRRTKTNVYSRQLITLDADYVVGDLWSHIENIFNFACTIYSTHSHSSEQPRLRLIIPLNRAVTPDEYQAISRRIASDLGIDMFDDSTYVPERLMFWPSTSSDGEFLFRYQDKTWLNPDKVLERYEDWKDPSLWPVSSRATTERQRAAKKQGNPLEKKGLIGAFCRTYTIQEAIEEFLSDVYEPNTEDRYTFLAGSTAGGLVIYDDVFAYSHHGSDPIGGTLVNAFDLVRIHKYGHFDEVVKPGTPVVKYPSYMHMLDLVQFDENVLELQEQERDAAIDEDFEGGKVNPLRLFFEEKRFIPKYMGEWFLKYHHCFVLNSALYVYLDGVYIDGERIFHEKATAALGVEFMPKRVADALAYIKNTVPQISPHAVVDTGKLLNLKNGLLNLNTLEFRSHTPELKTVIQLPVSYDPDADCSAFDEFLKKVLPADAIPVVEEMLGYCLTPTMRYEKSFVLHGGGGNGKGTLIAVLTALLGSSNVSSVSFQALSDNRFAASGLFGKMANLHADIPSKALEYPSTFKELASGDNITAEEKHKKSFEFNNRAKLIFSANEPPISKDNTEGFHRKVLMIPFPHKFTDRELRAKLFTDVALTGVLLRALEGLKRLERQGEFSQSDSVDASLKEYRTQSDTVMRFLEERCVLDEGTMTGKQLLYDEYRSTCFLWGNHPVNQAKFNARLKAIHPQLVEYRKNGPRRWRGLKLEPNDELLH